MIRGNIMATRSDNQLSNGARMSGRTGRRPGESGTREEILRAARKLFSEHGYAGTSIRSIAQNAGVDAALIHHFFNSKEGVFAAAMEVAFHPGTLMSDVVDDQDRDSSTGERLVRVFLAMWEDPVTREPLLAILRSAMTHEAAARQLRAFIADQVYARVAETVHDDDRQERATLAGSQLIGLAMLRYVLEVEPLASMPPEQVAARVTPTIEAYLNSRTCADQGEDDSGVPAAE